MKTAPIAIPVAALMLALSSGAWSQPAQTRSVGRGWPVLVSTAAFVSGGLEGAGQQASWDGPPKGIKPLPVDLFTTRDFYQDE